jgi:hypothetical protein
MGWPCRRPDLGTRLGQHTSEEYGLLALSSSSFAQLNACFPGQGPWPAISSVWLVVCVTIVWIVSGADPESSYCCISYAYRIVQYSTGEVLHGSQRVVRLSSSYSHPSVHWPSTTRTKEKWTLLPRTNPTHRVWSEQVHRIAYDRT